MYIEAYDIYIKCLYIHLHQKIKRIKYNTELLRKKTTFLIYIFFSPVPGILIREFNLVFSRNLVKLLKSLKLEDGLVDTRFYKEEEIRKKEGEWDRKGTERRRMKDANKDEAKERRSPNDERKEGRREKRRKKIFHKKYQTIILCH